MTEVEYLANVWAVQGTLYTEDIEQAKEMEKSQQFWNYMRGWDDGCQNKVQNPWNNNNKLE